MTAYGYVNRGDVVQVVSGSTVVAATWGPAVDSAEWFVAFAQGPAYRVADRAAGVAELHKRYPAATEEVTDG